MTDSSTRTWGGTNGPIVAAAQNRGIPVARSTVDPRLLVFGTGTQIRRLHTMSTSNTTDAAVAIAKNKQLTKALLARAGLPTPPGQTCQTVDQALLQANDLGYPVVVKPVDGSQAQGVSIDLRRDEEVVVAFDRAVKKSRSGTVLVEQLIPGAPHRLLIINGRLIGAFRHRPAAVTGNGIHSIAELIDRSNDVRGREPDDFRPRRPIVLDGELIRLLGYQEMTLASIPGLGQLVTLKPPVAYVGGSTINCSPAVHPETTKIAKMATAVVGLDIAGIDLVTTDITMSLWATGGAILEVNSMPALEPHVQPFEGPPDDYGPPVIAMLYPDSQPIAELIPRMTHHV